MTNGETRMTKQWRGPNDERSPIPASRDRVVNADE